MQFSSSCFSRALAVVVVFLWATSAFPQFGITFIQVFLDDVNFPQANVDGLDGARSVAVSPDGLDVYVAAAGDRGVSHFDRDPSTGLLTFVESIEEVVVTGGVPQIARVVVVSLDGFDVYVVFQDAARLDDNGIAHFTRDLETGNLTFAEALFGGSGNFPIQGAWEAVFAPEGDHLYISGFQDDSIAIYTRDVNTGELFFLTAVRQGEEMIDRLREPKGIAMSPDGQHVYVAVSDFRGISVFNRNTVVGSLTFVEFVTTATGMQNTADVAVSPDGAHVYVVGRTSGDIITFVRNPDFGTLTFEQRITPSSPGVTDLVGPDSLAISPDGLRVFVISRDAPGAMLAFNRDPSTGRLSFVESIVDTERIWEAGGQLTISPDGDHLYLASNGGFNTLTALATFLPNQPCRDSALLSDQLVDFAADFDFAVGDDIDGDGLPENATLALIEAVSCNSDEDALVESVTDAYFANLNLFDFDLKKGTANPRQYRELVAALVMVSAGLQTTMRDLFAGLSPDLLVNYRVVTCTDLESCTLAKIADLPMLEAMEVRSALSKRANEPLSGGGDADGDGVTNAQEYANIVAAGGNFRHFAIVAIDPALDGSVLPNLDDDDDGACFIATAAYGTPLAREIGVLRRVRDDRMLPFAAGAAFADLYYRVGGPVAAVVEQRDWLRHAARTLLTAGFFAGRHMVASSLAAIALSAAFACALRRRAARTQRVADPNSSNSS